MNQELIQCAKCYAVGWTEAAAIDEKVKKGIKCGKCGYVNKYVKKPWKAPVVK